MRRTGNTPDSPTIGMLIVGNVKMGLAPLRAAATPRVTTPAEAAAPTAAAISFRREVFLLIINSINGPVDSDASAP